MKVSRDSIRLCAGLLAPMLALLPTLLLLSACATSGRTPEQEMNVKKADSHRQLGIDHLVHNRPELALRELMLADRLNPRNPHTLHALAQAYRLKDKNLEAEANLLQALEIYPGFQEARFDLSTLYIVMGRFEDSLVQSQVLLDDPTFPAPWTAHNNQGVALMQLGRTAEAREHLKTAREFNDRYWPTLLNIGILESQEGHHLEAIEAFQQMLDLKPIPSADAEANYRLAEIYISLGKRDRALGHLKAAVAQAPGEEWGRKSEEYLKLLH